jgi:hypothetical protein
MDAATRSILAGLSTAQIEQLIEARTDWYTVRAAKRADMRARLAEFGTTLCDCGIMRATCARCSPSLDDVEIPEGTAPSRGNQGHLGAWINLDRAQYARTL